MNKKKITSALALAVVIIILAAVGIMFICLCIKSESIIDNVLYGIGAVLDLAMTALFSFIFFCGIGGKDENFFLYDPNEKKNIPVEDLEYKTVGERLEEYEMLCFGVESKNAFDRFLDKYLAVEIPEEYSTLFVPHMFISIIESNAKNEYSELLGDKELVEFFENGLFAIGMDEESRKLRYFASTFSGDAEEFSVWFKDNLDCMKEKMLEYIKANIEKYYTC